MFAVLLIFATAFFLFFRCSVFAKAFCVGKNRSGANDQFLSWCKSILVGKLLRCLLCILHDFTEVRLPDNSRLQVSKNFDLTALPYQSSAAAEHTLRWCERCDDGERKQVFIQNYIFAVPLQHVH